MGEDISLGTGTTRLKLHAAARNFTFGEIRRIFSSADVNKVDAKLDGLDVCAAVQAASFTHSATVLQLIGGAKQVGTSISEFSSLFGAGAISHSQTLSVRFGS